MWLITKVRLVKYKRLRLNEIETFTWTPDGNGRLLQILLGGNGSGKSSIIHATTPLPNTPKKDFEVGGGKYIEITGNDGKYVCSSELTSNGEKHSFIYNGEELNLSGQHRLQLFLCKQHFNLTPKIHEVLTGEKVFTKMTVGERKEWLTNIATVDYTYALELFKKAKASYRDVSGAIRLTSSNLSELEASMITEDEYKALMVKQQFLEDVLQKLYLEKGKIKLLTVDNKLSLEALTNKLSKSLDLASTTSKDSLYLTTVEIEKRLAVNKERMELANKELLTFKTSINNSKLNEEYEEVNAKLKEITDTFIPGVDLVNYTYLVESFEKVYIELTNRLASFNGIINKTPNPDIVRDKKEELDNLTSQHNKRVEQLVVNTSELKQLEISKVKELIKCTACGNEWRVGYNEARFKTLTSIIENDKKIIARLENTIKELSSFLNDVKERVEVVTAITNLFQYPLMDLVEDYLIDRGELHLDDKHSVTINALFGIKNTLTKWLDIKTLLEDKKRLEEELSKVSSVSVDRDRLAEVTNILHDLSLRITEDTKELIAVKNMIRNIDEVSKLKLDLKEGLINERKKVTNAVLTIKKDGLDKQITFTLSEISKLNDSINNYNNREYRLKEMRAELDTLELRKNSLKTLVSELSPDSGLIAESIMSFLLEIVYAMNEFIEDIWSYSLVIKPCGVTGNDLDYKFPINVNDDDEDKADVSMGSTGIKEVINLAFKIVSMDKLGLKHSPLILDEFASSFDNVHRDKAFRITDKLVERGDRQIFLISHFNEQYSTLANADVIVLNDSDLKLDMLSSHNDSKIVKIENR